MGQYNTTTKIYNDYLEVLIEEPYYKFTPEDIDLFKKNNKIKLRSSRSYDFQWYGSINDLPDNITHLQIPNRYKENIDKYPLNLKVLILNSDYNKCITLPEQLEEFICPTIGSEFNQNIIIPPNIKLLQFGDRYNQPLNNLPNSLETLILSNKKSIHPLDNLPCNLKTLKLLDALNSNITLDYLPINLTYLEIIQYNNIDNKLTINIDNLPSSLQTLKIKIIGILIYDNSFRNLPLNLENFYIDDYYDKLDLSYLPDNLKNLYITNCTDIQITKLPSTLEKLHFTNVRINNSNTCNNILQIDFLPLNLKEFSINSNSNSKNSMKINSIISKCLYNNISIILPDSIVKLKIYDSLFYNNSLIELDKIPMSCEYLDINIYNNIETRLKIKEIKKIPTEITSKQSYLKSLFDQKII